MTFSMHIRAILVLGLPLIGGHLAQFAIGLTDTIMMGWYGVEALAAITLAGSYFFVFFLFGSGFAWAVMPMVAAAQGSGDDRSIRRATRMGLWLSLLFSTVAMPVMIFAEPILLMLGQDPVVSAEAARYLSVAGWGLFPALLVMAIKSYLSALERTQIVLWITLLAAVANGLANYMLIFGNWGAPELGIIGAAIASLITQLVSLVAIVIYAMRVLPEHELFARFWRPDWEMFFRVARLGIPIGLTTLSEVTLFTASALMMGWLGTVELAAHGVVVSIVSAAFMLHLGLSNAATVRAGNAYGRKDRPGMSRGAWAVITLSLIASVLTVTVFFLYPADLIVLFLEETDHRREQIIAIGIGLLAVGALFQLADGMQVIALGLLRGVQDTAAPMVMAAVSYWGVGIPASYVLGFVLEFRGVGIWLGLVAGLTVAAILLMARFWTRGIGKVPATAPA